MLQNKIKDKFRLRVNQNFLQCFLIIALTAALYIKFLSNPIVFDDVYFFNGEIHPEYLGRFFGFDLRWLPYATFEWTRIFWGQSLFFYHLGNLALHIVNSLGIFFLLQRLFSLVIVDLDKGKSQDQCLSSSWLAFFAALLFALHPISVYAVAYLSQRTTLFASFFVILMLRCFIEGLHRNNRWYFVCSVCAYFFAVFSKESAVMAPCIALLLIVLLEPVTRNLIKRFWLVFLAYLLIALFLVYQLRWKHLIGQTYEVRALDMMSRWAAQDRSFDPQLAYPLSILTQTFLFFKYWFLWLLPDPAWLSVDMAEDFNLRLWSWPYLLGLVCFVAYGFAAISLLLKRGEKGLLGLALLFPWVLFATEFATVRMQETFVLYRSYLWMMGFGCAFQFIFRKLPIRLTLVILVLITCAFLPMSWNRLTTFSHPYLLWDDAAHLVENKTNRPGVERIFYNRGHALLELKHYSEAIDDYNRAIDIYPQSGFPYFGRAAAYLKLGKYPDAINDFNRSISLNPEFTNAYLGRASTYEAMRDWSAAIQDYLRLCSMNIAQGCKKVNELRDLHSVPN